MLLKKYLVAVMLGVAACCPVESMLPGGESAAAAIQDPATETAVTGDQEGGWLERYGMELPRPVDPERRQALGYAEPRAAAEILEELHRLSAEMRAIAEEDEVFDRRADEYRAMQRARISMVSELEESRYVGDELNELLALKLTDIRAVWSVTGPAAASYLQLRKDVTTRYGELQIANRARSDYWMEYLRFVLHHQMRVHPGDFEKLAEVETLNANDDEAGMLIIEALSAERKFGPGDPELSARWEDWILENLGAHTMGYRTVMRKRMFGSPVRLVGEDFAGRPVDTAAWGGEVIIIDFWGMWCLPCIAAMPQLKALQTKYADRGLRIVGVLCDHEIDKAERFVNDKGFDWPQLVDRTLTASQNLHPIAAKYAVRGFPTYWIIDRQGVLRERVWEEDLEAAVLRYLDE